MDLFGCGTGLDEVVRSPVDLAANFDAELGPGLRVCSAGLFLTALSVADPFQLHVVADRQRERFAVNKADVGREMLRVEAGPEAEPLVKDYGVVSSGREAEDCGEIDEKKKDFFAFGVFHDFDLISLKKFSSSRWV